MVQVPSTEEHVKQRCTHSRLLGDAKGFRLCINLSYLILPSLRTVMMPIPIELQQQQQQQQASNKRSLNTYEFLPGRSQISSSPEICRASSCGMSHLPTSPLHCQSSHCPGCAHSDCRIYRHVAFVKASQNIVCR